jgi:hypothetical protein
MVAQPHCVQRRIKARPNTVGAQHRHVFGGKPPSNLVDTEIALLETTRLSPPAQPLKAPLVRSLS